MEAEKRRGAWPWAAVLVLAPIVVLMTFGMQAGRCVDYADGAGLESSCESGPAIGWPGAVLVAVLCTALCVLAVAMLVRRRRTPDWSLTVEDGPPVLTEEQRELLAKLERKVTDTGPDPTDGDAVVVATLRLVLVALRESGLSTQRIADHSSLRLESIARILR
ncbi:hypothetical protein [Microbacterium sp. USHLN186]|uniref:hypothetical protein n=1 Tax=Microbacterium sp. USHLN186 TaxID=3081286 RepID=UPI003015FF2B